MSTGTQNHNANPVQGEKNADLVFGLSLTSGVLIIAGSVFALGWNMYNFGSYYGYMGNMMERSYYFHGMGPGFYVGMFSAFSILGAIAGLVIIVSAILMRSRPLDRKTYGVVILIFSILSLAGMGGLFIGAILGVAGGLLALTS